MGRPNGYLIRSLLYGTQPMDATVFAAMITTVLLVAVMASVAPAWKATSVDPMQALRTE